MQEVDSERRIRILRGLQVTTPPPSSVGQTEQRREGGHDGIRRERKVKKIAGEDDTERDIRLAQEHNVVASGKHEVAQTVRPSSDAPLTDRKGNINLFPEEGTSRRHAPKNAEAEADAAVKKKEFEDQYTMRFSNAAGKQAVGQKPWYHSINDGVENRETMVTKNVWGNEDPRRKEREKIRLDAEDPLAAMQKGQEELREVKKERKRWKEERGREMREIIEADRARAGRKRKRSRQGRDMDSQWGSAEQENKEHQGSREDNGVDRRTTSRRYQKSKANEDHELEAFSLDTPSTSRLDDEHGQLSRRYHSRSRSKEDPLRPRARSNNDPHRSHHRNHPHHYHRRPRHKH